MRHLRKKRIKHHNISIDNKSKELVELWVLRIILKLNAKSKFIDRNNNISFEYENVAHFLELDRFIDNDAPIDKNEILEIMGKHLETLESREKFILPKILKRNIKKIEKLIALSHIEKNILIFAIYLKYYDIMDSASRMLNEITTERLIVVLSVLLECKKSKIKDALSPRGKLAQSGLVTLYRRGNCLLETKIEILSDDFADKMMNLDGSLGYSRPRHILWKK